MVVLLHGLYGRGAQMRPLALALGHRYKTIAPDLRNHGNAPRSDTLSIEEIAQDIETVLAREQIYRYALVGHSLGGRAAMRIAQRNPNAVWGCVSIDAPPPGVAIPKAIGRYHQRVIGMLRSLEPLRGAPRSALHEALKSRGLDDVMCDYLLRNYRRIQGVWDWRIHLVGIANHVEHHLVKGGSNPLARPLAVPFLLVKASHSPFCREVTADALASFSAQASMATLEKSTHRDALFSAGDTIKEWLDKIQEEGMAESCTKEN